MRKVILDPNIQREVLGWRSGLEEKHKKVKPPFYLAKKHEMKKLYNLQKVQILFPAKQTNWGKELC